MALSHLPARGAITPEDENLRHLLHGSRGDVWRVIYAIEAANRIVTVLHIRHAARDGFTAAETADPIS